MSNTTPSVEFSIPEMEYGRSLVKIDFNNDSHEFWVANFLSCDFFDLMEVMFWMNEDLYREALETLRNNPRSRYSYDAKTKAWSLHWDLEGGDVYLTLSEKSPLPKGDVELKIDLNYDTWVQLTLPYKSLCYTVVKAINDIMAKQGLLGINWTNENQDLNIRHFLHLKAYVMDLGAIDECDGLTSRSNLENDLKLLAMPMP